MPRFQDIRGQEEAKRTLKRVASQLNAIKKGERAQERALPKSIMIYETCEWEEPRKEELVEAFLEEAKLPHWTLSFPPAFGDDKDIFLKKIQSIFHQAYEQRPSIVYLKDIDRYAKIWRKDFRRASALADLIAEVKPSEVFVIATASSLLHIPFSLLPDEAFEIGIPLELMDDTEFDERIQDYLYESGADFNRADFGPVFEFMGVRKTPATISRKASYYARKDGVSLPSSRQILEAVLSKPVKPIQKESREHARIAPLVAEALVRETLKPHHFIFLSPYEKKGVFWEAEINLRQQAILLLAPRALAIARYGEEAKTREYPELEKAKKLLLRSWSRGSRGYLPVGAALLDERYNAEASLYLEKVEERLVSFFHRHEELLQIFESEVEEQGYLLRSSFYGTLERLDSRIYDTFF